jgi:hypothetical protein
MKRKKSRKKERKKNRKKERKKERYRESRTDRKKERKAEKKKTHTTNHTTREFIQNVEQRCADCALETTDLVPTAQKLQQDLVAGQAGKGKGALEQGEGAPFSDETRVPSRP